MRRSGAKEVGSEVGSDEVSPGTMAQNTYGSEIPVWDGDPNSFERFASACQWYSYGLKDNERHLAAARVWNKMTGPAKGVVRHLSPEEFACSDGISKLLEVLRASPLQKLPIPDSFSRLEKWSNLGKRPHETIPQLIVREEELFTEVQASLKRAREMAKGMRGPEGLLKGKGKGGPTFATRTSTTPAQDTVDEDEQDKQEDTKIGSATGGSPGGRSARTIETSGEDESGGSLAGFFEDELRGYRLLKACQDFAAGPAGCCQGPGCPRVLPLRWQRRRQEQRWQDEHLQGQGTWALLHLWPAGA